MRLIDELQLAGNEGSLRSEKPTVPPAQDSRSWVTQKRESIPAVGHIEQSLHVIRGQRVMLDADLADLYGVGTRALKRQVRRNLDRFPQDFTFQLNRGEFDDLRCQVGTSSRWGGTRYLPYAFTEQGVAMLSSVLRSQRAVRVNIEIMRAFVRLRDILSTDRDLARKLDALEQRYDRQFKVVFDAIRRLMEPAPSSNKRIGFRP